MPERRQTLRRAPLGHRCRHSQGDEMSKWKTFPFYPRVARHELPVAACVYAVYFDSKLVYIGQTRNLRNRFAGHAFRYSYGKTIYTPWCEIENDVRITIKAKFSERLGDWAMWEIRLIDRLNPEFNQHHRNKLRVAANG